jgi:hypothetical protein
MDLVVPEDGLQFFVLISSKLFLPVVFAESLNRIIFKDF